MTPIYKDPSKSIEERVADLLPRMTLEEKISQMRLYERPCEDTPSYKNNYHFDEEIIKKHMYYGGSFYTTDSAPAEYINQLQDYMLHKTRLGIPMAVHSESLHGGMNLNTTVFPNPIAFASTFDTELIKHVASTIGEEVRANGVTQTYAPNLDLTQDPRWGRCEENYGEDPYLTARMGVAYIQGLQSQGIAASPKHYAAHGTPQGGINQATVHCGERELREVFLYPFKKAFTEGGAMSVMPAYSEIDGIPCHANHHLLTDILRDEWGFEGTAVSDWNGLWRIHALHNVAETPEEAGELGLRAGIDMEAPSIFGFGEAFVEKIKKGEIPMELVDQAVARVLRLKFKLGLFENPYAQTDKSKYCHTKEHLDLSQHVEEEAAVLLKNENHLLPLSEDIGKIALIGPNTDVLQLGDYTIRQATERAITIKQAMEERLGKDRVIHARGCNIAFGTQEMVDEAVKAVQQADVAVVVLGDNSCYYNGEYWSDKEDPSVRRNSVICGETFDVTDINLPPVQQQLLETVWAQGKPVVLVMQSGRPHSINWAVEHVPAILEAWYAGEVGGYAICNLLFGDANPSGRLPWSIPRSVGHIPCYYYHKASSGMRPDRNPGTPEKLGNMYVFDTPEPLFPFGYGLSYTQFEYSDLKLSQTEIGSTDDIQVSVKVKNTGDRVGKDSVLMYLQDMFAKVTPAVRRLRGFHKVELQPGEEKTVTFTLGQEDYEYIGQDLKPTIDPGTFTVYVGDLKASFRII